MGVGFRGGHSKRKLIQQFKVIETSLCRGSRLKKGNALESTSMELSDPGLTSGFLGTSLLKEFRMSFRGLLKVSYAIGIQGI